MYDKTQSQKGLLKVGKFCFKPSILAYFDQRPKLREKVEKMYNIKGPNPYSKLERKFQIKFLSKLLPQVVKTSHTSCFWIEPSRLINIGFTNLRYLHIQNLSLYNIECLQFFDLKNLQYLDLNSFFIDDDTYKKSNKLKSIKPLVKCHMPNVNCMRFSFGSCKSMGKDVSRMSTSKSMKNISVQWGNRSFFNRDGFLDEDMSIWVKLSAKKILLFHRLTALENWATLRIRQKEVEKVIQRKYYKVKFDYTQYIAMHHVSDQSDEEAGNENKQESQKQEQLELSSDEQPFQI